MLLPRTAEDMKFLDNAPRFLFFTGKGGVGKKSVQRGDWPPATQTLDIWLQSKPLCLQAPAPRKRPKPIFNGQGLRESTRTVPTGPRPEHKVATSGSPLWHPVRCRAALS